MRPIRGIKSHTSYSLGIDHCRVGFRIQFTVAHLHTSVEKCHFTSQLRALVTSDSESDQVTRHRYTFQTPDHEAVRSFVRWRLVLNSRGCLFAELGFRVGFRLDFELDFRVSFLAWIFGFACGKLHSGLLVVSFTPVCLRLVPH